MAESVLIAIDLCRLISETGIAVYDAANKVADNFKQQRRELGGIVEGMRVRVERLKEKLEERRAVLEDSANIRDLKKFLDNLDELFRRIKKFYCVKLEKYETHSGILIFLKRTVNYYDIEHKFKDFNNLLVEYEKQLNKKQKDIGLEVVMDIQIDTTDMKEKQEHISNDVNDLIKLVLEVKDGQKEHFEEIKRKLEFDKRRIHPDGKQPNPIRPEDITEEMLLYEGKYWTIHTAIIDREKVMVKRVRDVQDHNVQASFQRETVNLMKFSSGSIIRVIGMCDKENEKFLVLEYMEKGDLSTLLHKSGEKISLRNKVDLACTAASSFYVMNHKLVHTSLRTEKFLVDKHYTAKLSGMAYAKTFSSAKRYGSAKPLVDATFYLAPENYQPRPLSPEMDVYGFGIVLWEIFTQTKPFSTFADELGREPSLAEVEKFVVADEREEYNIGSGPIEESIGKLIRECRALDPKKRPTVSEILDRLEEVKNTLEDPDE